MHCTTSDRQPPTSYISPEVVMCPMQVPRIWSRWQWPPLQKLRDPIQLSLLLQVTQDPASALFMATELCFRAKDAHFHPAFGTPSCLGDTLPSEHRSLHTPWADSKHVAKVRRAKQDVGFYLPLHLLFSANQEKPSLTFANRFKFNQQCVV